MYPNRIINRKIVKNNLNIQTSGKDNIVLLGLLEKIIEYLKHNEWQAPLYDENDNLYCSECSYTKAAGHDENCKIDKFLKEYNRIIYDNN